MKKSDRSEPPSLPGSGASGKAKVSATEKRFYASIRGLARRVVALREEARRLGLWVDDRELLTCPGCGLAEDVAFSGMLFTYRPPCLDVDTGLRFDEKDAAANKFQCPACGVKLTAVEEEPASLILRARAPAPKRRPSRRARARKG